MSFIFFKIAPRQSWNLARFAWYSNKIRVIFVVRFKDEKLIKKASLYENWDMQTLF